MEKFFPKEKLLLTGNPVRQDIANIEEKRNEAFSFFKLDPSKKTVLVIGGSLGAKAINEAMGAGLQLFADNNIQLVWQTGKIYFDTAKKQTAGFETKNITAVDFISRMDLAYAFADVVISRAGAGAISELCIVQKPCILVPLPTAAEDHQTKNAMALVNKNAAILVKDTDAVKLLVAMLPPSTEAAASYSRRALAFAIDLLPGIVIAAFVFDLHPRDWTALGNFLFLTADVSTSGPSSLMLGASGILTILVETISGASIGKWIVGIRVASATGGEASIPRRLARAVLTLFAVFSPILLLATISHPRLRGVPELLTNTEVVTRR